MKISVVIPVYNEEKSLGKCLDALANQEIAADEVIIVNNNSTDRSMEIAKKYNTEIKTEKRQGIIYARTTGFSQARYDIIAKTDADTFPPTNWIKRIKQDFQEHDIDAILGSFRAYDISFNVALFDKFNTHIHKLILGHYSLLGPNLAISRRIWEKIKTKICINEEENHEDVDLAIHIYKEGGTFLYDPDLFVYTSARRALHNPLSFFIKYPLKTFQMKKRHETI